MTPDQLYNASSDQLGNDPAIERQWAEKAYKHAETYEKMLSIYKDKRKLKLTPIDDEIYTHFRRVFPDLNIRAMDHTDAVVQRLRPKWMEFIRTYKDNTNINDYTFGTLLRKNSQLPVDPDNTVLVTRMVFLAVEIAEKQRGG